MEFYHIGIFDDDNNYVAVPHLLKQTKRMKRRRAAIEHPAFFFY
jgi:hypothetical protein